MAVHKVLVLSACVLCVAAMDDQQVLSPSESSEATAPKTEKDYYMKAAPFIEQCGQTGGEHAKRLLQLTCNCVQVCFATTVPELKTAADKLDQMNDDLAKQIEQAQAKAKAADVTLADVKAGQETLGTEEDDPKLLRTLDKWGHKYSALSFLKQDVIAEARGLRGEMTDAHDKATIDKQTAGKTISESESGIAANNALKARLVTDCQMGCGMAAKGRSRGWYARERARERRE